MFKKIKEWYDGEIKTYDDPNIFGVYTERHWSSNFAHILMDFYFSHWKWIWTFGLGLAGFYLTYSKI